MKLLFAAALSIAVVVMVPHYSAAAVNSDPEGPLPFKGIVSLAGDIVNGDSYRRIRFNPVSSPKKAISIKEEVVENDIEDELEAEISAWKKEAERKTRQLKRARINLQNEIIKAEVRASTLGLTDSPVLQ